jgi:hypothetical protein
VEPLVRAELRRHELALTLDLAPGLPPVLGDRVQLQQVLLNLVMNGIEAMAAVTDRPRELLIRSHPHEEAQVLVAVQDTGVGIDPSDRDQLFSAFFTTKPAGMGMGLSISRSIVEAHGSRQRAAERAWRHLPVLLSVGPAPALASIAPGSRPSVVINLRRRGRPFHGDGPPILFRGEHALSADCCALCARRGTDRQPPVRRLRHGERQRQAAWCRVPGIR